MSIGAVSKPGTSGWIPPVDIVLEMDSDTNPAALYAGTVWMQLKNVIIVAAGDIFKAGTTGGSARIVLTESNLPKHTHTASLSSAPNHTHTVTSSYYKAGASPGAYCTRWSEYAKPSGSTTVTTSSAGAHTHTGTIASTGGGQAFSILNPYYAVNIWQRIG